jgi:hypothetical protein
MSREAAIDAGRDRRHLELVGVLRWPAQRSPTAPTSRRASTTWTSPAVCYDGGGTGAPTGSFGSGVRGTGTRLRHDRRRAVLRPGQSIRSATLGRDDGKNYLGTLGDDGDGGRASARRAARRP